MTLNLKGDLFSKLTVFEKTDYKFKNWRHARARSVVFAGCGFPSAFPKTFRALMRTIEGIDEVGLALDCCGLPLEGLKGPASAQREMDRVGDCLARAGAREVVPVCPNCASAFNAQEDVPQRSIYALLRELSDAGACRVARISKPGAVFVPCPDREKQTWLADLSVFLGDEVSVMDGHPCCGAAFEFARPEAAFASAVRVLEGAVRAQSARGNANRVLYVYCASCACMLERARRAVSGSDAARVRVVHVLSPLLGVDEEPAVSTTVLNRAKAALL